MSTSTKVAAIVIAAVIVTAVAVIYIQSVTVHNVGTIRSVGVDIFTDATFTTQLKNINWGIMSPGDTKGVSAYLYNPGNVPIFCYFNTTNWSPIIAQQYIVPSWDYGNQTLNAGGNMHVNIYLYINASLVPSVGIANFTYDMTIYGQALS